MSWGLRLVLIVGSIAAAVYVLRKIRRNKMSMESSVFWILFSGVLVLLGIFPGIAELFARLIGVQSTVNLVYLGVIALLLIKVFLQDQRIARLEHQVTGLTQRFAIFHETSAKRS